MTAYRSLLVVEGRGIAGTLASCGLDLSGHPNLHVMGPPDARGSWVLENLEPLYAHAFDTMISTQPTMADAHSAVQGRDQARTT